MIKNFINGSWVQSKSKEYVDVYNPATNEKIAQTPISTENELNEAIEAAKKAFVTWRETPAISRVQPLFRLKALMEESFEELSEQITIEHGKTLNESRGSIRRAIQMVETATGIPALMMGKYSEDIASGIDSYSVMQPMGVFAAIAPFNFPAMVPFWFWPFAVATGNTYILKPSERVPLTQQKIFKLIEKAGFPDGVINLVNGGKEVSNLLCTHRDIKGVSFVGSTPVAKHIYQTATNNLKRVQALGGAKNFMVVMPDAIMDKSVSTALESIIGCAGERCLAGSVVICVGDKTYKEVQEKMVSMASKIKVGNGLDPDTQMGPIISEDSKERILGLISRAEKEGAKILLDGRKDVDKMTGYYLKPTVLGDVTPDMEIAKEEIFGPVICLAKAPSLEESIDWLNSSPFANTTTLFTTSGAAARKFSYKVHPGMVGINIGVPAPMAFFSFGGSKESFFGDVKVHGQDCIGFYTDTKVTIQRWEKDSEIW